MNTARGYVEQLRGTWYLRIREPVVDESGKTQRRQRRVRLGRAAELRTHAQARNAADAYLAKLTPATLQPGKAVTFVQYSEKFAADHVARFKPSSRRRYLGAIRILQKEIGRAPLASIDSIELQSIVTRLGATRAPATVRLMRTVGLQILRRARLDRFATHVIETRSVQLPKVTAPVAEAPHWSLEQVEQMVAASSDQFRVVWAIMALAGLRCGECFGLRWSDVDLAARTLTIRRTATRNGMTAPKTTNSGAVVPLLPRLVELLEQHRGTWRENALGLVFATGNGNPLNADTVRTRQWARLLQRLSLPHAGLHSLRHSTPRILFGLGLSTDVVRRFMRHSDIRVTMRYTHTADSDVRLALDAALARQQLPTGMAGL